MPGGSREIDYAMVSHWHGDHTGDLAFGGKTFEVFTIDATVEDGSILSRTSFSA